LDGSKIYLFASATKGRKKTAYQLHQSCLRESPRRVWRLNLGELGRAGSLLTVVVAFSSSTVGFPHWTL
jgi:hypothetical protein